MRQSRTKTVPQAIKRVAPFLLAGGIFLPLFYFGGDFLATAGDYVSVQSKEAALSSAPPSATHVKTPEPVKSIYMTSWVAGTPSIRERVARIAEDTEINSIVIDIKDYTGYVAFEMQDPYLRYIGASDKRVSDMGAFIERLHKSDIYVIGRIAVFQDPQLVKKRPDLAVRRSSDGAVWHDYKGISWIDAGAKEAWEYASALARESYKIGFDEINFDYIRFPSDGNMKDIAYPWSDGRVKADVMREFFKYLSDTLRPQGIPISADFFGMTTTNTDDLNIGQVLENAIPYFDWIAPMVYPSHYPHNFNGLGNPNARPYDVVHFSLSRAAERTIAASSTPAKIRPWLQDFDYGGNYDAAAVRTQIQATYDAGLTSWMLWDPANKYTIEALEKE